MPNFDGGHYFLTALAPIRTDVLVTDDGMTCSPMSALHRALYVLPTALQSPVTEAIGINSPFSRSLRTHFARFAILDDVVFNGRRSRDAIRVAALGPNPTVAEPVDALASPYLVLIVDFDAASGAESELRSYLDELWRTMSAELKAIFASCHAFEGIDDSAGFQDYILRCQIETTMPFNDYWVGSPPLPTLSIKALIWPPAAAAILVAAALTLSLVHAWGLPWLGIAGIGAALLVATLALSYRMVMSRGAEAFPAAPGSDLPSVLKALYLQQRFTRFAIEAQGAEPRALHEAFGRFMADHRPADLAGPTQGPGLVRS